MKGLIIILLVIIILGLYYAPKETKSVMHSTGNAVKDGAKIAYNEVKESNTYQDIRQEFKEKLDLEKR